MDGGKVDGGRKRESEKRRLRFVWLSSDSCKIGVCTDGSCTEARVEQR